jgi:uncharacterized protein
MNKPLDLPVAFVDPDDLENNRSGNPHFQSLIAGGMRRRTLLRGGLGTAMATMFAGFGLTACGGGDGDDDDDAPVAPAEVLLGFTAVAKAIADQSTVPAGYTARTIFACGDPLAAGVAAYRNDGTDTNYAQRSGDCHDGIQYFGLSADGRPDASSSNRALLGINHEYVTPEVLHVAGPTGTPRPAGEADVEIECHGVSIVEIAKGSDGVFAYVQDSPFNRRMTGQTEIELSGPARGNALFVTRYSPDGTRTRGSLNNCGNGKSPWGTLLTTEENWSGYYFRAAGDDARRSAKVNASFARYGRNVTATTAAASRYGWETAGADDRFAHFNTSVTGNPAGDGSDDYRHSWFCQGFMVEIDPYDPTAAIKKRTGMGRFAHENGAFGLPVAGRPLAVYMGCDSQNEYVYKWVSAEPWDPADATAADRMAVGDKYLDAGKLYVARYDADGTGRWLELSLDNPAVAAASFGFTDQADICINARIAADAAGATRMDRPEWVDVHPTNGEIYITMTNNSSRRVAPTGSQTQVDPANPRAYTDVIGATRTQNGNVNGHIVRMRDTAPDGVEFRWDVYLFGAEADADPALVNLSQLGPDQDFSSPDGLAFTPSTGICWIQTDDFAYRDRTNNVMLASLPGTLGDGAARTLDYAGTTVSTFVGAPLPTDRLKRFYIGPNDCEVTGCCETPDGTVMFVCIQHPGDSIDVATLGDPSTYPSQWPSNEGYGNGQRPRSGTVMITKNNGGRIGT